MCCATALLSHVYNVRSVCAVACATALLSHVDNAKSVCAVPLPYWVMFT